jgi:hypothetical protein
MHAISAAGQATNHTQSISSGMNTHHRSDLVQSSGLLRAVAEALVATAARPSSTQVSTDRPQPSWPLESLIATANTFVSLTSSPGSRIVALCFPCIVGLVDSIRIHLDSAIEQITTCPPVGVTKSTPPAAQPLGHSVSVPQHAAVTSCMAVLIQVLQCHPLSQVCAISLAVPTAARSCGWCDMAAKLSRSLDESSCSGDQMPSL